MVCSSVASTCDAAAVVRVWCPYHWREGAGIAQWLERRTRDRKVAGSNPCSERRENFLLQGRLPVLTLISVSVPPPVLPQKHVKDPGHSAKKCRWQVTAKHAYTLRMWILLNRASALVSACP